jgi:TP901 family phage tail tape measure protein
MPEEITQRLGFDASKAIQELGRLRGELNNFKQSLQSVSGALRKFPGNATPAIKALRQLALEANNARAAVQGLATAGAPTQQLQTSAQTAAASMGGLATRSQAAAQQVGTAVTGSFNQAAQSMQGAGQAAGQAAGAVQQGSAQTAAAAGQAAGALNNAGQAGQNAAKTITISWKTVLRVVQAQLIVRAISAIVSAFKDAQTAAAEFSVAVAEAFTISGGQLGSMDQMNASVLELSRSLGLTGQEIAEGVYQTLSNQVVEAGDALRFTNEAARLSIATNSELRESVNAISSVMNSYNLNVAETAHVSDVLFKTIELGRLRLSEFGDVLGRVSPLTAALGIRYEEMAAALAAMTQKGVPAHTAITQLTQVSQKLLRPTQKLQELYEEWGVETGPEAIRRFGGLQGVLLKMKDATAGNDKEFADLLGRVRAMVGALNLTSNEANALTEALEAMENSAGATGKALEEMRSSVGRQAVEAWNNLGNTMIEVGQKLLEITTPMVKALDAVLRNMDLLKAIAVGTIAGLAGMKLAAIGLTGALSSAAGAAAALGAALLTIAPIILAIGAAMAAIKIGEWISASLDTVSELEQVASRNEEQLTRMHELQTQKRIAATRKEFEERRKLTGEFFSEASKQYRRDFDILEASSKAVGKTLESTLDNLLQRRQDAIKALKDTILEADSAIKESMEEVASTQQSIADTAFEREKRHMSARQQLWAEIERAQRTAAEARKAYADAGANEEAARAARELSHLAEKRAQDAVSHAEELGNYGDLRRAENELDKVRGDRIRGEISFQIERKKHQSKAHKERLQQLEAEGKALEQLLKKAKELLAPFEKGELKGPKQMREDFERVVAMMPEIEQKLDAAFDFSMYEKLGIGDAMGQLKQGVLDALKDAKINWDQVINEFQGKLQARTFTAPVKLEIVNEHIIEEFVKRFGEIDPLKDPGKMGAQMEEVLEGIKTKYEDLTESIQQDNEAAFKEVIAATKKLQDDEWFNWWDKFRDNLSKGGEVISNAYERAAGDTSKAGSIMEVNASKADILRKKLFDAAVAIREAVAQQKPLTEAQRDAINAIKEYGVELQENGELSRNMGNQGVAAYERILKAGNAAIKASDDLQEKMKLEEPYKEAIEALDGAKEGAEQAKAAQEGMTTEAGETKQALEDAKNAQVALPGVATTATQSLSTETEQARQLKVELQGATQAQKDLIAAAREGAAAPGEPGAPAEPAAPREISLEELQQQLEAARRLSSELGTVNEKYNAIVTSTKVLAEAMSVPSQAAVQLRDTLVTAEKAAIGIGNAFAPVTEQVNIANVAVGNLITSLNNAKTSTDNLKIAWDNVTTSIGSAVTAAGNAAQAMQNAAKAAIAAAQACARAAAACAGGGVGAAHGGRYFQDGGRGTDRIPAWLTPGEFVVNARAARNFFPQLQAINAGQQPIYRDQGGAVTNIGDINVTVQGGDNSSQTIREIASGLRRELKRKTARIY